MKAEKKSAQVRGPVVEYDPNTDTLTVRANDVAFESLLRSVAAVTGIEIVFVARRGLDRLVSADLSRIPLEEALAHLLRDFGNIIVHSSQNAPNGQPRITRVLVGGDRVSRVASAELAERPGESRAERARRIADAVASSETPAEDAAATDALVSLLDASDQRAYDLAVRTLRDLDPERAIDELERRLDEDPEADEDARGVSERRTVAAAGIGTVLAATPSGESPLELPQSSTEEPAPRPVNADSALDALMEAFSGDDAAVRMAAAQSLARAGDPRANAFLLSAASDDGQIGHKVSAAMALVGDGDSSGRDSLKQGLDQGTITPDGIMQAVIALSQEP